METETRESIINGYMRTTRDYLSAELAVFGHLSYSRHLGTHLASLDERIRFYVDTVMPFDSPPHGEEVRKEYTERVAVRIKDEAKEYRKKSSPVDGKMPTDEQSRDKLLSETLLQIAIDLFKKA